MNTRKFRALIASVAFASNLLIGADAPPAVFKAGTGKRDVTPKEPVPMWGYGARHATLSTGTSDPLYASAVVLQVGDKKLAMVGLDLGRSPAEAPPPAGVQRPVQHDPIAGDTNAGTTGSLDDWFYLRGKISTAKCTFNIDFPEGILDATVSSAKKVISNALDVCGIMMSTNSASESTMEVLVNIKGTPLSARYGQSKVDLYTGATVKGKVVIMLDGKLFDEVEFDWTRHHPTSVYKDHPSEWTMPESAPFSLIPYVCSVRDVFRAVFWLNRNIDFAMAGIQDPAFPNGKRIHGYRCVAGLPFEHQLFNKLADHYAIFRIRSHQVANEVAEKLERAKDSTQRYVLIMGLACLRDPRVREIARREIVEHPENRIGAELALYMLPGDPNEQGYEVPPGWTNLVDTVWNDALGVDQILAAGTRSDPKALAFLVAEKANYFRRFPSEQQAWLEALGIHGTQQSLEVLKEQAAGDRRSLMDIAGLSNVWERYSRKTRK